MNKKIKNSEDFLKNLTQKEHGFSVSKNYFDSVEDTVLSKVSDQYFPEDIAFIAPDNYFSTFDEELLGNIDFPKKQTTVISLKSRILKFIPSAAAAAVLLFIGLNYFSYKDPFNAISSDEVESWFNESYIEDSPSNTSFEFVDADFTEHDILEEDTSIDDDDILDYLNTIDNATLLTEIES